MALRKKTSRNKSKSSSKSNSGNHIVHFFFNKDTLPFILAFAILCTFFVGFRMKGIEQAYVLNDLKKKIHKVTIRNKELKAQRARSTSVQKLRSFALKYHLKEPGPEQIIHIP